MIEINVTNFITVGIMALIFFSLAEVVKRKMGIKDRDDQPTA